MSGDSRLPDLFAELSELAPGARRDWLAALAVSEPGLAQELSELVAVGESHPGRLERPILERMPGLGATAAPKPPATVGSYRIVREIGRGGMGRVYLAEQETPAFRRRVALKLLDAAELNAEAIRRFRDEVRILASLEHPGIARFLDGGRAEDGTWFLALEFVEGEDLETAARRQALSIEQRVHLMVAVLEAVAYAHDRHVVHRDLKPSNILVGPDGTPRLLDFGISKLFDPRLAGELTVTRTEMRAFTPAYASPEQYRGESASPASDVYSAGVLFYELLTGVRPHGSGSSSRVDLERAVLEDDPDPPSTAARRKAKGSPDERDEGAAAKPGGVRQRLSRDLDAICLRALRKNPGARYASAADFAADLRSYLAGGAIAARKGAGRYRFERVLRRVHGGMGVKGARLAAVALIAAISVAVVATVVAVRSLERAEHPRDDPPPRPFPFSSGSAPAIEEGERLFAAAPASVEAGAAYALGLQRVGRAKEAALIVARLRQIPGKEEDPLTDYVDALGAMGGNQSQRALILLSRALASAVSGGRGELVAQIRATRGRLYSTMGRRDEARAEMEQARAAFVAANDPASLARVLNDLAIEEAQRGDLGKAEAMFEQALTATRAASPANRGAAFLNNLATLAMERGHPDLAEKRFVEAIAITRDGGRQGRLGLSLGELSEVLRDLGRPAEADRALEEGLALVRQAGDQTELARLLAYRGIADVERGRLSGIGALVREIETLANSTGNTGQLSIAEQLAGELAFAVGDLAQARSHLAETAHLLTASSMADLIPEIELRAAEVELASGDLSAASHLSETAIAPLRGRGERAVVVLGEGLLARAAAAAGRPEESRRRLAAISASDHPGDPDAAQRSPSLRLRLAFLRARAAVAAAERDFALSSADLELAIAAARAAERHQTELGLRLDLAETAFAAGDLSGARRAAAAVAREAGALGLLGLVQRAERTSGSATPRKTQVRDERAAAARRLGRRSRSGTV